MISQAAFWDASALVPLCAGQVSTPRAVKHYKNFQIAVWWATPVEIAGALARLARMSQLTPTELAKAQLIAKKLAGEWVVIHPTDALLNRALDAVSRYGLRAADALQLAAALEWCHDSPQGVVFLTADKRLRQAANLAGFDAKTV